MWIKNKKNSTVVVVLYYLFSKTCIYDPFYNVVIKYGYTVELKFSVLGNWKYQAFLFKISLKGYII